MGDFHQTVIHDDREIIRGHSIGTQNDEIPDPLSIKRHPAFHQVFKFDVRASTLKRTEDGRPASASARSSSGFKWRQRPSYRGGTPLASERFLFSSNSSGVQ